MWDKVCGHQTLLVYNHILDEDISIVNMHKNPFLNKYGGELILCKKCYQPKKLVYESQLCRLGFEFANSNDNFYLTADIDMLPLNGPYFNNIDPEMANFFGSDLYQMKKQPICYIGMKGKYWNKFYYNGDLYEECEKRYPNIDPWYWDEEFFRDRFNETKPVPVRHIKRGTYPNGYPVGRVDRGCWSLDHKMLIDCHMLRPGYTDENFNKMIELINKVLPDEDKEWIYRYREEFIEQLKNDNH